MDKIVVIDNPVLQLIVTNEEEFKVIRTSEPTIVKVETPADLHLDITLDEKKLVPIEQTVVRTSVGMAFTDLIDAPASYVGQAGRVVGVNPTEQGLEFMDPGTGGGTTESDDCIAFAIIFGS